MNLDSDVKLTPEELQKIDTIDKKVRFNDPSPSFGYDYYAGEDGKK